MDGRCRKEWGRGAQKHWRDRFRLPKGTFGRLRRGMQGPVAMQTAHHVRAGRQVAGAAIDLRQRNGCEAL